MSSPLVSIIIPTFNREKELSRAIDSVFKQTYTNWEVCLVDNNSSDNTINLIKSYNDSRIKLYMIENNGVIAASRNLGIQNAKGKYLAFLDSDDWWKRKKLAESVKILEQEEISVVYHDLFIKNKKNQKFFFKKTKSRKLKKPVFNDLIINGNTLLTSSVVLRREVMTKINGFNEDKNLVAIEDYNAWLKIALANENFLKISKVLGYYWLGGNNTSNPKRSIQTLDELENKFKDIIVDLRLSKKTYWFSYSRGRAYYKMKMRNKALLEFYSALAKDPVLNIKCKSLIMIVIIRFKNYLTF